MKRDPVSGVVSRIDAAAARSPAAACLTMGDVDTTFEEFRRASVRVADELVAAGLTDGDRVAILSPNDPQVLVTIVGVLRGGFVYVPLNARDSVGDQVAAVASVGCTAVICHSEFESTLRELAAIPEVEHAFRLGGPGGVELVNMREASPGTSNIEGRRSVRPTDLAAIFATGGTTGRPKGVLFSHRALLSVIDGAGEIIDTPDLAFLAAMPLTHAAGRLCLAALAKGGRIVVLPSFTPASVLDAIENERVTTTALAPTMLYMLLDDPTVRTRDYSSLRLLTVGAGPVTLARLRQAIEVFGPVVGQGYGQTEAPLLIAHMTPEEYVLDGHLAPDNRLRSCGRPTRHADVRIADAHDRALAANQVGEILVRGEFVMDGYVGDAAAGAKASDGFHRTGDLGFLDDDGYLTIVGRARDMIISGGFNVYPSQIEDVLAQFPGIAEVCVVGIPDPKWGERVVAAVQPKPDTSLDTTEILAYARDRLGSVKAPRQIELVDELPRNLNGKVLKLVVTEQLAGSAARLST